jgi:hypothetical protein
MYKRKINGVLAVSLILGLMTWECEDNNEKNWNVNSDPVLNLNAEEIHSVQERIIRIGGSVTDEVGIKNINLNVDDWCLNRDILTSVNGSLVKSNDVWYDFKAPEDAPDKEYVIKGTACNMDDRSVSKIMYNENFK